MIKIVDPYKLLLKLQTQRFSKLNDDNDLDFDSDSRASTPSPEGVELSVN